MVRSNAGDAEPILPPSVLRNIGDKMYEKRKQAALEVEQARCSMAPLATHGAPSARQR